MDHQRNQADGAVLMVGSIPLPDAKTVFTRICEALPGCLRSIPDGETGERDCFCFFQRHVFPPETLRERPDIPQCDAPLKDTYTVDSLRGTGYDTAALASYATFIELRSQNVVPQGVRFQACLPTPFGVTMDLCRPSLQPTFEALYEHRLIESLERITSSIPHPDLLIQWDLPFETLALEYSRGAFSSPPLPTSFSPVLSGLTSRLARLDTYIPTSIPVGVHLCYGDRDHKHIHEPYDTEPMVDLANAITAALSPARHIAYVHMPVPIARTDTAYFAPLKNLQLRANTRLCLGLVHAHDAAGTRRRIEVARSVCGHGFDVATECGLGRTPPEDIESILEIAADVTRPGQERAREHG